MKKYFLIAALFAYQATLLAAPENIQQLKQEISQFEQNELASFIREGANNLTSHAARQAKKTAQNKLEVLNMQYSTLAHQDTGSPSLPVLTKLQNLEAVLSMSQQDLQAQRTRFTHLLRQSHLTDQLPSRSRFLHPQPLPSAQGPPRRPPLQHASATARRQSTAALTVRSESPALSFPPTSPRPATPQARSVPGRAHLAQSPPSEAAALADQSRSKTAMRSRAPLRPTSPTHTPQRSFRANREGTKQQALDSISHLPRKDAPSVITHLLANKPKMSVLEELEFLDEGLRRAGIPENEKHRQHLARHINNLRDVSRFMREKKALPPPVMAQDS